MRDPFLPIGSISVSKERLWHYNSQGNDVLNVCKSFLYYFAIEQTLHFPKFVEWCAVNYSPSQRIIVSHSKFDDLEKGLTRKTIVDKLMEDFEIFQKFLMVRKG